MARPRGWWWRRRRGAALPDCRARDEGLKRLGWPAARWRQRRRGASWLLASLALVALLVGASAALDLGWDDAGSPSIEDRPVEGGTAPRAAETGDADVDDPSATEDLGSALEGLAGSLDDMPEAPLPGGELAPELAGLPVQREESIVGDDVAGAARGVLERYQGQGGVSLAHAGWLDLQGRAWGCVASDGGWVEVCLVTWRSDAESVLVRMRMEAGEWERAYGASTKEG